MVIRRNNPFLMPVIAVLTCIAPASAMVQENTAPASPELRDFRLDPKPAEKPAEQPVGPPSETPPPSKPAPTQPATTPAPRPAAAPQLRTPEARVERTVEKKPAIEKRAPSNKAAEPETAENPDTPATIEDPKAEATPSEVVPPDTAIEPATNAKPDADNAPDLSIPSVPNWWLGFGALGLFALLAGTWLFRRRRKPVAAFEEPYDAADAGFDPAPTETIEPETEAQTSHAPLTAIADAPQQPSFAAEFTPEQAQLSIANLTISGKLALRNAGKAALRNVTVRTTMISASEGQRDLIRQFHDDDKRGHAEPIGDAKAGEEIALSLEIQQPRVELNEFDWRERRFMAPIVLIHISGRGPKGLEHYELSCLIGRENAPDAERMKPFHTDRGPRRFEGLGMRLVQI
jgi:hypothetical protein